MIRVFKNYDNRIDEITDLVKSFSISGSLENVSRQLSCSIIYAITDKNMYAGNTRMQLATGTKVWVLKENKEIFRGIVVDRTLNDDDTLEVTAFDYAYYLTKNKVTYNFSNTTADRATKQILQEIGVQAGNISNSNINLRWLIAQKSAYESIMEVYTQVSKQTGKQYFITMSGTKVNVVEMGSKLTNKIIRSCQDSSTGNGNLLSFSYKDSISSMINRVKIYDENNNYVSKVENSGQMVYYGILQENYVKEKDKDATIVAKNMLHGIDKEVECTVLGNWDYRTGYAVHTQIPYVDILQDAVMHITADTHNWDMETGEYLTELTLSFVCKMDVKDSEDTIKFDTKQEKKAIREEKKIVREKKIAERKAKAAAKRKETAKKKVEKAKKKSTSKNKAKKRR